MEKRRPSDANVAYNPLEDPQFADTIQDFLTLYSHAELDSEPFLQTYLIELLARWGRWHSRGRAPALCFEAACVGGLSFLNKTNREPTELTGRADATLARLLAGLVIDEVEPMARQQGGAVREKAVGIVADEFLARAVSPRVANSAKKRMKKRKTVVRVSGVMQENPSLFRPVVGARRPSTPNNYPPPPIGRVDYVNQGRLLEQPPGPGAYYQDTQYNPRFRRNNSTDIEYPPTPRQARARQVSAPEVELSESRGVARSRTATESYQQDPADPRYFQQGRSGSNEGYALFERRPSTDNSMSPRPGFAGIYDETALHKPRKDSLPDPHGYLEPLPYRSRSSSIDRTAAMGRGQDIYVRRVRPPTNFVQPNQPINPARRYEPREERYLDVPTDNRAYPVRPGVRPLQYPNFPGREPFLSRSEPASPSPPSGPTNQLFANQRRPSQDSSKYGAPMYRPSSDPNLYGDPFKRPLYDDRFRKPQEYSQRPKTPSSDPPRAKTPSRENSVNTRRGGGEGLNTLLQSVLAECEDYMDQLDVGKSPK